MCPSNNGACKTTKDRRSTTMLYYRRNGNAGMLYDMAMGGVILKPDDGLLLCAYAADGGTRAKLCPGTPHPPHPASRCHRGVSCCVPGCISAKQGNGRWCDANNAGGGWCQGQPFRAEDLGKMLGYHSRITEAGKYNEIIIDAFLYAERLPGSVEAFFYLAGDECDRACRDVARHSHALFVAEYGARVKDVPLLVLDLKAVDAPLSDALGQDDN
jgi:hypothetical protein